MFEWMDAFAILLVGHVLGDFYLQSRKMATQKVLSVRVLLLHSLIYAVCMAICCMIVFNGFCAALIAWVILGASHLLIDAFKRKLVAWSANWERDSRAIVFLVDQFAHILICALVANSIASNPSLSGFLDMTVVDHGGINVGGVVALVLALMAAWRPAAILIKMFLSSIGADSGATSNKECNEAQESCESYASSEVGYMRAGKWIGILERTIVVVMTFWGEYSAIAFVFTAKSIARFSELSNRDFAERYLTGTLASVAFAIGATLISQGLLGV